MKDEERTTIAVSKETKEQLEQFKLTPGQSMDDVIRLLLAGKTGKMKRLKNEIISLSTIPAILNHLSNRLKYILSLFVMVVVVIMFSKRLMSMVQSD